MLFCFLVIIMNKINMEYPADVELIIEYTKLRKKYPELDKDLRADNRYKKDSLKFGQMMELLEALRNYDKGGKK